MTAQEDQKQRKMELVDLHQSFEARQGAVRMFVSDQIDSKRREAILKVEVFFIGILVDSDGL